MLKKSYDQIVYLLQGGGALGSYQVGVCEVFLNSDCAPDWLVGTSIGAINASIIAGNHPKNRIKKLKKFWNTITFPIVSFIPSENVFLRELQNLWSAQCSMLFGQPGFFTPRLINPWFKTSGKPDELSYYDTTELRSTLENVIDFDLINQKKIRLSLGAVNAVNGKAVRFDNFRQTIGPEHVMASCALPPGLPAVKIDDNYYWDGGISSNTPFSAVLEEKIPKNLLCVIVNLFSFPERLPTSMAQIVKAKKELEYTSRHQEILRYFCELHFLQNTINSLAKSISHNSILTSAEKQIAAIGHPTSLNIVHIHYKDAPNNLWSKDFNFSSAAVKEHYEAGRKDALKALKDAPWPGLTPEACPLIHDY